MTEITISEAEKITHTCGDCLKEIKRAKESNRKLIVLDKGHLKVSEPLPEYPHFVPLEIMYSDGLHEYHVRKIVFYGGELFANIKLECEDSSGKPFHEVIGALRMEI